MNSKYLIPPIIVLAASAASAQSLILQETQTLEAAAWRALPREELSGKGHDQQDHQYSGVPLTKLLEKMGAPAGETLRGQEMNRAVLLTAADGYQVVLSLAELDSTYRKNQSS